MQPRLLLSLLLGALPVSAFSDTSPYFLISSVSTVPESLRSQSILSTSSFLTAASDVIRHCDADAYIIVAQPGLHVEDLTINKNAGVHLKDLSHGVEEAGRWVVDHVFADVKHDMGSVVESLQGVAVRECDALVEGVDAKTGTFKTFDGLKPKVVRVDFDRLPPAGSARAKAVEQHDAFLHSVMEMVPTKRYTIVYVSSPLGDAGATLVPVKGAEQVLGAPAQGLELRSVARRAEKNNGTVTTGGLFHRYQFFTPAIFMGYIVFFLMLVILYVGLSAVSSIGVSYGSFEKEMGPAAAKKQ